MTTVDLIVVNYRTPALVEDFIESYRQADIGYEHTLTIVDVNPITPLDRRTLVAPVNYMSSSSNIGYSGACNMAAAETDGDVLAFFNSDVRLYPQSVDKCVDTLMGDPDAAVVGPLQLGEDGRVTHAGVFGTNDQPRIRAWRGRVTSDLQRNTDCLMVFGSAFFTKRKIWDELTFCAQYQEVHPGVNGAFLPTPHYYEETWYCYHARAHGYSVVYCGEATMYHGWHKSSPVGGATDKRMPESKRMFRAACDHHGIIHD